MLFNSGKFEIKGNQGIMEMKANDGVSETGKRTGRERGSRLFAHDRWSKRLYMYMYMIIDSRMGNTIHIWKTPIQWYRNLFAPRIA